MTRKEFVEKLFGTEILTKSCGEEIKKGCQGFKCHDGWCDSCRYADFWNKDIDYSDIIKTILNMSYGAEYQFVIGGRGAGKTFTSQRLLELSGWERFPRMFDGSDFDNIRDIIDDALTNGFEFTVYNSTLYYREKGYANTDSAQDVD